MVRRKRTVRIVVILILFVSLFLYENNIFDMDVYAEEVGNWSYTVLKDNTVKINKYKGKKEKVYVPSKIKGKTVISIGDYAFWHCTTLKNVVFPKTIKDIGDFAFEGCSELIRIENMKVTSIGDCAFRRCEKLTDITISASVTNIGNDAFNQCNGLKRIVVEKNNRIYDSRNNCNAIIEKSSKTLIVGCNTTAIPKGIRGIAPYAFAGCSRLEKIAIPESVITIGDNAFAGCSGLKSVIIPKNVKEIGKSIFAGCSNLKRIVVNKNNKPRLFTAMP